MRYKLTIEDHEKIIKVGQIVVELPDYVDPHNCDLDDMDVFYDVCKSTAFDNDDVDVWYKLAGCEPVADEPAITIIDDEKGLLRVEESLLYDKVMRRIGKRAENEVQNA